MKWPLLALSGELLAAGLLGTVLAAAQPDDFMADLNPGLMNT
jgi:hypothetical protein